MYFLRSKHLGFRLWAEADLDLAIDLWGDAQVTQLIGGPFTEDQIRERLAREIANMLQYSVQYWPIFLLSNDEHVGCCGLRPHKLDQRIYEIGFHLRSTFWGQGLATEAATAVIEYAFSMLNVNALFAGHNPANQVSRHVLEKLGFRYTHDEFYPPTGLNHPSYLLFADNFARQPPDLSTNTGVA